MKIFSTLYWTLFFLQHRKTEPSFQLHKVSRMKSDVDERHAAPFVFTYCSNCLKRMEPGEQDLSGSTFYFMNADDLQHLREEMLICLMSRCNLWEAAWFISNIWKALLISSVLLIIRWFSHSGKGCECECLPGWFCSCWQSNGSVHCCMWTVCDVWDSFEILSLKWGTHMSPYGGIKTWRRMYYRKMNRSCLFLRSWLLWNGLDRGLLSHISLSIWNPYHEQ